MNKQEMKFWARMFENVPVMSSDIRQGWIDNPKALQRFLAGLVPLETRLSAPTPITLPAAQKPQRLADRTDVRLFSRAVELFGSIEKLPAMRKRTLERRDLEDRLDDFELIDESGGKDVTVSDSIARTDDTISRLIDAQPDGALGHLLTDGRANILFVRDPQDHHQVLYVHVRWFGDGREWHVYCEPASSCRWPRGDRVLKDVTAALPRNP